VQRHRAPPPMSQEDVCCEYSTGVHRTSLRTGSSGSTRAAKCMGRGCMVAYAGGAWRCVGMRGGAWGCGTVHAPSRVPRRTRLGTLATREQSRLQRASCAERAQQTPPQLVVRLGPADQPATGDGSRSVCITQTTHSGLRNMQWSEALERANRGLWTAVQSIEPGVSLRIEP
jgi:hypothetical protein